MPKNIGGVCTEIACNKSLSGLYVRNMRLAQKTAIITGSTGQIGSQIALALAKAGCDCICHYHSNSQKAQALVSQIRQMGKNAVAAKADLGTPEGPEELFEQIGSSEPRILVNSAAIFEKQPLTEITFPSARRMLDINLTAPSVLSRLFIEKLGGKLKGTTEPAARILNITDVGGIRPWANYLLYCSSKAALIAATKTLAKELAPAVLVNSLAPGAVTWPEGFDEAEKDRQIGFVPMKRLASMNEITQAAIFLLTNDYITGQTLNVDGGRCI